MSKKPKIRTRRHFFFPVLFLAVMLGGCSSLSESFGYAKNPPDEFNVTRKPPLILPPDYQLRPPDSNIAKSVVPSGGDLARLLVLGVNTRAKKPDAAAKSLLAKASRGETYGDGVREKLNNERTGTVSQPAEIVDLLVKDATPKTK